MPNFKNRIAAGEALAERLGNYKYTSTIVYGLPRGGVMTAAPIAEELKAPLDVVIVRKIGHPGNNEYALGAILETGEMLGNSTAMRHVDQETLIDTILHEKEEAVRRRKLYPIEPVKPTSATTAILVDDGVATGYTLRLGIRALRQKHPQKIVVAVPVVPETVANLIAEEADDLVALTTPRDEVYYGAVGAYYENFDQVTDEEVCDKLVTTNEWWK